MKAARLRMSVSDSWRIAVFDSCGWLWIAVFDSWWIAFFDSWQIAVFDSFEARTVLNAFTVPAMASKTAISDGRKKFYTIRPRTGFSTIVAAGVINK